MKLHIQFKKEITQNNYKMLMGIEYLQQKKRKLKERNAGGPVRLLAGHSGFQLIHKDHHGNNFLPPLFLDSVFPLSLYIFALREK